MRRIILISAILFLAGTAQAQLYNRVFVANDFRDAASDAIVVKWAAEKVLYERGFHVYRQELGGSDWQKLNNSPLLPIKELPAAYKNMPEQYQKIHRMAIKIPESDLHPSAVLRAFITLEILRSREVGELLGTTWYDATAQKGKTYRYQIEAVTASTPEIIGETAWITSGAFEPLPSPTNIKMERSKKEITMVWEINEEVTIATVVEKAIGNGAFEPMDIVPIYVPKSPNEEGQMVHPSIFIADEAIEKGVNYRYRLAAVDVFGQVGQFSEPIFMGMKGVSVPLQPQNTIVEVDDATMQIAATWEYPADAHDMRGFVILYRNEPEDEPKLLCPDTLNADSRAHTFQVTATGNYTVGIAAVDVWGNVSESLPMQAQVDDVLPPQIPKQIKVALDSGVAVVSWSPSPDADSHGYFVYRYLGNKPDLVKEDFSILTASPYQQVVYRDTVGAYLSGKLYYAIAAIDNNYNRSAISTFATVSLPDFNPPMQPFIKQATAGEKSITVEFMPNVDDDLKHFVLRKVAEGNEPKEFLLAPETAQYEDNEVKPGLTYTYTMMAEDLAGNKSDWSSSYEVVAAGEDLSQLQGILPSGISAKQAKNKVVLSWKQQFTANNLGAAIYKGTVRDELALASSMLREGLYEDSRIVPGNTYYYQVRTYAANGAKHLSDIIEITIKKEKK